MAKRRLADEYDAAQERGDAASQGRPKKGSQAKPFFVPGEVQERAAEHLEKLVGPARIADIPGLTKGDVHEARQIRDAEVTQRFGTSSG